MNTHITNTNELTHFTAVFSKHGLAADLAPRLSCIEVEALAGLLRALGEPATADTWIQEHATDDEPGDAHHQGDTLEYLVPIDPSNEQRATSNEQRATSNEQRALATNGVWSIRVNIRSEWSRERRPACRVVRLPGR